MKKAFDDRMEELDGAPIPPWGIHDLRRTARSLMSRAGIRPDICERVLGHAIPGVWGVYDRYSYEDEKGETLAKFADLIERIVSPEQLDNNPISLRFRQHQPPNDVRLRLLRFWLGRRRTASRCEAIFRQVDQPHGHTGVGIAGHGFETETAIKRSNPVIERMRQHTETAKVLRNPHRRRQCKEHQRAGAALSLIAPIHGELTQQDCGNRIGLVALARFGEKRAFDIGRRQTDKASNGTRLGIAHDADTGNVQLLIVPCVATEPRIQGVASAIKTLSVVIRR